MLTAWRASTCWAGKTHQKQAQEKGGEDAHGSRAIVCSTLSSDTPILVLASSLQSQPVFQSPTHLVYIQQQPLISTKSDMKKKLI